MTVTQESIARDLHERYAPEHVDHWDQLDDVQRHASEYWDMAAVILTGPVAEARLDLLRELRADVAEQWFTMNIATTERGAAQVDNWLTACWVAEVKK